MLSVVTAHQCWRGEII